MKPPEQFRPFYDVALVPSLQNLETERKKLVRNFFLFMIIPAVAAAGGLFFVKHLEMPIYIVIVAVAGMSGTGLFYAFNYKKIKSLKIQFKKNVIEKMVKFIDESLHYSPESRIHENEYHQSKLFLTGVDRYSGDDLVNGTIGKTGIKFSEVHSEYKTVTTDKNGRRRETWHTIFRGIFFIGDFNKNFNGETIVLPDTAENLFGSLGSFFQKMNVSREQLVKLEDPEFEKYFCVYSNDQVEARYILSTKLMQRITELKKKSKKKIRLSFINSKVFIAISIGKNLFEPPFFRTMLNYNLMEEFFNYLHLSVGIVEELDLNTRIWTKT